MIGRGRIQKLGFVLPNIRNVPEIILVENSFHLEAIKTKNQDSV